MRTRLAILLLAAGIGLACAGPAAAITRAEANRIALQVLRPERVAGEAILFGFPAALPASSTVREEGPKTTVLKRPGGRAWLFWLDLGPGELFEHASRALLVDDRTGRVLTNRALGFFPLVDGKAPAFLKTRTAYWGPSFHVYSSLGAPRLRPARPAALALRPAGIPAESLAGECLLLVVHNSNAGFQQGEARQAMERWSGLATSLGIPSYVATNLGPVEAGGLPGIQPPPYSRQVSDASLQRVVQTLVDQEHCKDIAIYLLGHGLAPPGWKDDSGQVAKGGPPMVIVGQKETKLKAVTAAGLERIVHAHTGRVSFKFIVESCFAERFEADLIDEPNVKIFVGAAKADETARGYLVQAYKDKSGNTIGPAAVRNEFGSEFSHGLIEGVKATVANAAEVDVLEGLGDSLFARLIRAGFDKESVNDRAAKGGLTHPVEANNLSPAPHAVGPLSHQHRAGQKTLICGYVNGPPGTGVTVLLTHKASGRSASTPLLPLGAGGRTGFGFTLSENGAYTISALVNGVAMASADYVVPDEPVQGAFGCTSG